MTPHNQLQPGLWYIKTTCNRGWGIVSLTRFAIGPDAGKLGVWQFDEEGNGWPEDFGDVFIGPVKPPEDY